MTGVQVVHRFASLPRGNHDDHSFKFRAFKFKSAAMQIGVEGVSLIGSNSSQQLSALDMCPSAVAWGGSGASTKAIK
jgi:hypothetical protein